MMSFSAPLFLLGLAGAALPIVIHLIGRRRAPRLRFAALDFVLRSNKKVARRLQLRQLLLLMVRALLLGGVAVIMAKPFVEVESDLPAVSLEPQSAVLILDDTLSMKRVVEGETLFARVQEKAQQLVTLLGSRADIAVLRVSLPSLPLSQLVRDGRKVRSAISSTQVSYRHSDHSEALAHATQLLADAPLRQRHIYLLSDMARHGWNASTPKIAEGIKLHLIDVAQEAQAGNRAVVGLTSRPSSAPGARSTKIIARMCNYSAKKSRIKATLAIDDVKIVGGLLRLKPWACGDKAFQHSFSRGGVHRASVAIEPDALPADDERYLMVEVESPIRVLLVNGGPSPVRHRDELFYLEAALAPEGVGGQPIVSKTITTAELERTDLGPFDVLIMCNLPGFPQGRVADLKSFISGGGGLLLALGDNADVARLNGALGDILPQKLRGPLSASIPGSRDSALRLGRVDHEHPVFMSIWTQADWGGLRSARFFKTFRLEPAPQGDRRTILWYDDGSPALIEAQLGQGRTMLFTSTLDRDWNDLPIRPGYLPLIQQIIRYLSRLPGKAPHRRAVVGATVIIPWPQLAKQLKLVGPDGGTRIWRPTDLNDTQGLEIPVNEPGFYSLKVAGGAGAWRALARESFAANVDPKECDLRQTQPDKGVDVAATVGRAKRRLELWHVLGALLLLLVLGESFLTRRG